MRRLRVCSCRSGGCRRRRGRRVCSVWGVRVDSDCSEETRREAVLSATALPPPFPSSPPPSSCVVIHLSYFHTH